MKKGVICPSCGEVSRGIRLFCGRCGQRMPKGEYVVPGPLKLNTGYRTLRNILLLVFSVVAVLILWRESPTGHHGTLTEADDFQKKMDNIELAVRTGILLKTRVTEQEINAYLAEAVRHSRGELEAVPCRLMVRDVNIRITPEKMVLLIRADWGPLCLSYLLAGLPLQEGQVVELDVTHVKLGHLPIPFFLREMVTNHVCLIFQNLRRIEKIMTHVSELQISDGALSLTVGPQT